MKSAKDRMDIISAYQQLGSYRAAAEACGTTTAPSRRSWISSRPIKPACRRHRGPSVRITTIRWPIWSPNGSRSRTVGYLPSDCSRKSEPPDTQDLIATSAASLLKRKRCGAAPITAVDDLRCGEPGEYLVIDWAQVAPGLFLFCAVLAFSRWRFVRFATNERASTTLALIAEAMAAIGGVPARVLADRMACLKGGVVANVVVPTPDYVRLAGHYGFAPISVTPATRSPRASWRTCAGTPRTIWPCHC